MRGCIVSGYKGDAELTEIKEMRGCGDKVDVGMQS